MVQWYESLSCNPVIPSCWPAQCHTCIRFYGNGKMCMLQCLRLKMPCLSTFECRPKSNYLWSLQSTVQYFCGIWRTHSSGKWHKIGLKFIAFLWMDSDRKYFRRLFSLISLARIKISIDFVVCQCQRSINSQQNISLKFMNSSVWE